MNAPSSYGAYPKQAREPPANEELATPQRAELQPAGLQQGLRRLWMED